MKKTDTTISIYRADKAKSDLCVLVKKVNADLVIAETFLPNPVLKAMGILGSDEVLEMLITVRPGTKKSVKTKS